MNETRLKEHLLLLEQTLLQHDARSKIEVLDRLLADDFVEYGSSGRIFNKQVILKRLPSEQTMKMTLSHFEMKLLAPNVVQTTFQLYKHETKQHSLRSSIWKRNEDHWQMVFHQGTPSN
jgi:hypothetical protein